MQKTKGAPQWVWSTFEHADNVDGERPSFFDPACHGCEVNRQTFPGVPNQVRRTTPIQSKPPVCNAGTFVDDIADLNRRVGAALAEQRTPLANYLLVSTQWPTFSGTPSTVFTVRRAREITLNTYEMLPPPQVVAKLHCGSCHLDAGTNVRAAWWVGSSDRYPTRSKLFARINHCFTNSMNGNAICDSDADCERNADMMALVEYIEDLTGKWHAEHPNEPAPCAFPTIPQLTGDPDAGGLIYQQKCAFCHGANGEGRYESGTYYRPALWGDDSFNTSAGMAKPATLAAFIHANMPLGSGGELTPQEAWNLAAFIDGKTRPKGPAGNKGTSPTCPPPPQP